MNATLLTQDASHPVTFTADAADGSVTATAAGNAHFLTWYPRAGRGDVYRDDDRRPLGLALSEHAFHIQAADFFHITWAQRAVI